MDRRSDDSRTAGSRRARGAGQGAFARLAACLLSTAAGLLLWSLGTTPAGAATAAAGTVLSVQAHADYYAEGEILRRRVYTTGAVSAVVGAVESLDLSGNTRVPGQPGANIALAYLLANTGNTTSEYTLQAGSPQPGTAAAGCDAAGFSLAGVQLIHDTNNNGVADAGETPIPAGGSLRLGAGRQAALLVVGSVPASASGSACLTLTATTALQGTTATVATRVAVGTGAGIFLTKSAAWSGADALAPGAAGNIRFDILARNQGSAAATATATGGAQLATVRIDGVATPLLLLRDRIPAGTRYVAQSLKATTPGARRLFRLPGDPEFSYTTLDHPDAVEVAIGLGTLAPDAATGMSFDVRTREDGAGLPADIVNHAWIDYQDAAGPASLRSNTVVLPLTLDRIGIALAAGRAVAQHDADGNPDGTGLVRFTARVRNYGSSPLFNVQVTQLLDGAARFGAWSAQPMPAAGQYTIVAGSVRIASRQGSAVVAAPNAAFSGRQGEHTLLAPGAYLPVGAGLTVEFDARINFSGRNTVLNTSATATAGRLPSTAGEVTDESVDGADPDPSGMGQPHLARSLTPVEPPPALGFTKTAEVRRVGQGIHEIDYRITVRNAGLNAAAGLRVLDDLDCAIHKGSSGAGIESWQLVGQPVARNGRLGINPGFTGKVAAAAPCGGPVDPAAGMPLSASLSLTDGQRGLQPGESEEIAFTVRVRLAAEGTAAIENKAWVASFGADDTGNGILVSSSAVTAATLLVDPQGIVYDSVTRQPVAGAVVKLQRQSCTRGTPTPITAAEIFNGTAAGFVYDADGSVSMTTGADGQYQFFWNAPPLDSICTYGITVTPPAGYTASAIIPAAAGVFGGCGTVVPNDGAPQAGQPTTWHAAIVSGHDSAAGTSCEVLHNHIPLDVAGIGGALLLRKEANKKEAEFGDFVDYALTVTNKSGLTLEGVAFDDALPPGFAYIAGSARIAGRLAPDPGGAPGPRLAFDYPALTLKDGQSIKVQYRVRIGVGAPTSGEAINRARARSSGIVSNDASWRIRIEGGPFSDEAYAFGKVHLDCNANGEQDGEAEPGIPGVRLFMENGTSVTTDAEGRWSLYGLKPITHVIKVDGATLPAGARLAAWDNRNAGSPDSRFLDVKKGEFAKANFLVANCDDPAVRAEVEARRTAAASAIGSELDTVLKARLGTTDTPRQADLRGLPAAGSAGRGSGSGMSMAVSRPLLELPAALTTEGAAGSVAPLAPLAAPAAGTIPGTVPGAGAFRPDGGASLLGPLPAPGVIELEKVLDGLDTAPGFIGLADGDTVPARSLNLRVKGVAGTTLAVAVNGTPVPQGRVGKKAMLPATGVEAWEYIGIALRAGANTLELTVIDPMGNPRGRAAITVTAPDELGAIHIDLPEGLRANPGEPATFTLRLTDARGVPVTARTPLTLEADNGRWLAEDLNPQEPGTQVFIEGGQVKLRFEPPADPGSVRLRASSNLIVRDARADFLPAHRPMRGIGIVEGVIDLGKRGRLSLGPNTAANAFEHELAGLAGGDGRAAARGAFYFKGTIKGEYLLTTAYDSDKTTRDRMFRDIRPDELYPVYGDDSERAFDAQSTRKLYVRIDKDRSYLLHGDFTTASSTEVRQLSQVNRALTGIKHQYESEGARITSFASRDSTHQRIEELPANGLSFYVLSGGGDIVLNSERVELVVRSRGQPQIVLGVRPLAANSDYSFEPLTGRLILVNPVASVDPDFNPQSIRVTYEVDTGGPEFLVAGTDAQFKIGESIQAGVVAMKDDDPENPRTLKAVTALARLGEHTVIAGEAVRTESDLKGQGGASRVEIRHADGDFKAQAQLLRTDTEFDNPSATATGGRTEGTGRAEYKLDDDTRIKAAALYSKLAGTGTTDTRTSVSVAVQRKLGEDLVAEVGLQHGNDQGTQAGSFDYGQAGTGTGSGSTTGATGSTVGTLGGGATGSENSTTVRGRLTSRIPALPQAEVFGEIEQDLEHGDRRAVAVGGNYALTDKTRLYGRHEFVSSLLGAYNLGATTQRNTTVFGIDSAYMEGGRVYNEYRRATSGGQNATGLRNTFKLTDTLRMSAGFERTRAVRASDDTDTAGSQGTSTAITLGADYADGPWRATGALEARDGAESDSRLFAAGVAYKFDRDWTALVRSTATLTDSASAGRHLIARQQFGLAWRPAYTDRVNGLLRYEYRHETLTAGSAGSVSGYGSSAALPGTYRTHIITGLGNYNPARGSVLSARYAAKFASVEDDILDATRYWAQLAHLRYTRDLGPDWDIGVQGGLLWGQGGARQHTLGLEAGYQVLKNLWLSAGYNVLGLDDPELTGADYTSRGAYVRLRFKFDENTLGLGGGAAPQAAASPAPLAATPAAAPPAPAAADPLAALCAWQPGQPLPACIQWSEERLFEPGGKALSATGQGLIDALVRQLAARGDAADHKVAISVGHGDTDRDASLLWLARAATLRSALQALGPLRIGIAVDSQPLQAADLAEQARQAPGRSLHIAVTARSTAAPLAAAAPTSAQ
ncbi:DUF11 domain-containing protein [Thauera sinica]|uniref:DUF11 domain-containing protein n=1 Tax=Thauera sp. K11 TaxID=2005884 RepID=UPI000BBAC509|nr:DUF11 domain-containing protein [Thauera sp. K11]ATE60105.1 hypothetical protein CCZ27_09210 [Thauera sp. K11]